MTTEDAIIRLFNTFRWPRPGFIWPDRKNNAICFTLGYYRFKWELGDSVAPPVVRELVYTEEGMQGNWIITPNSERKLGLLQGKVRDAAGNLHFPCGVADA